ncbi:MAG TPA: DNA mismatch repair protein MutS [Candidatus Blautia avistercoris]|uniref:DNA mismatch repair protein MutS n=1 Tax=Blautia sp. An249 TaxID=1965603 RepID=UPI000B36808A|nr:DNA mismatch repair protein MutS [Blautia sp. An249]OUO80215.1 DNA mismatch repair protein MutS [Blautia sp. An249]HIY18038.1 DNA mismatch repair protein MutS [Candidatus Blautia avistercoris]
MALSPMMREYLKTKDEYRDCILLYRLGDFYEMFFEDALTASRELEITLTGKDCGLEERAPMCGVPFHAVENYINRLIEKGYKVAICEQVEDPKKAKGLVKREVVRVVTPGTTLDVMALDETKNNYLMSIVSVENGFGCAIADITTGDCYLTELEKPQNLLDEINKFVPAEIICNDAFLMSGIDAEDLRHRLKICIYTLDAWYFDDDRCRQTLREHFQVGALEGLGLGDYDSGVIAAGALFQYLMETQKSAMTHMTSITPYLTEKFMLIDSSSRRNLELVETLREKQKRGSLLWVLDKTKTAMGARMLRSQVEQPLIDKEEINRRLEAIEELNDKAMLREEIREYLSPIYDLERLISRISYQTANPRDMVSFSGSLAMLPHIRLLLKEFESPLLKEIYEDMDALEDVTDLIHRAIIEEPPLSMRDGGIIKEGYHEDVDNYRESKSNGKKWLSDLEARERERTGIKTLRIKFNRVFGYSLEVTNSFKDLVPEEYVRKQTLTNAERYITQELKNLEDMILGAEDKLYALEYELFCDVRKRVGDQVLRIQKTAKAVAALDVLASLSVVAQRNHYVRPSINQSGVLDIKEGRHPVVEQMIENDMFISNDTYLDNQKQRVSIITGPNMAGKSTYMRQTALIVLMAQIGSFVPAKKANIGIVDRIFTRVGASDDLASGQSTFMVEMTEVANILRNATNKSLLILDEIGRGTSTFDGLSIAWAVIEHISNTKLLGAKTLFATHYHELTELEGKIPGVHNYCIAVKEKGDDIVFLRKIVKGGADKSYGIQVAKLAGVPETVLSRARELVEELSDADITAAVKDLTAPKKKTKITYDSVDMAQMSLFDTVQDNDIIEEIKELDVSNLTPMEALNILYQLQNKIKNRW